MIDDDDPPSKRILHAVQGYQKAEDGPFIAERIGLNVMRSKCPHFDEWLKRLEALV